MIKDKTYNKISIENQDLKEVIDTFKSIFSDLSNDAELSSMLLDQNIHDSFSKVVSSALNDPLKSTFDGLKAIEIAMLQLINESVKNYFESNKKNIKKVFKHKNTSNLLHYSVILSNDSMEDKSVIYRFLNSYEKSPYSSRFPIIIQDIPNQLEKNFKKEVSKEKFEQVI